MLMTWLDLEDERNLPGSPINLDPPTYASLVEVAKREDVSVSWVVRRAIETLLARDRAAPFGPALASRADEGNRTRSGEIAPQ